MKAFVSYAHDDHAACEALRDTVRSFKLEVWHDTRIRPGTVWNDAVSRNLEAADIFLVLTGSSKIRVLRGGSWRNDGRDIRAGFRSWNVGRPFPRVGFRLARTL